MPAARVLREGFGWIDVAGRLHALRRVEPLDRERLRLRLPEPASAVHLAGGEARIEGFELPVLVFRRDLPPGPPSAPIPGAGERSAAEPHEPAFPGGYEKAGVLSLESGSAGRTGAPSGFAWRRWTWRR